MTNIIRKQNGSFTVVRNALVNDTRLSLEAIGLLTWLLSKPDNWKVIQSHIAAVFDLGRDKVRKIVNELIQCGYLLKSAVRNEGGEYAGVDYVLYDFPPETENPASDKPTSVNQALVNTNSKQALISRAINRGSRVSENFVPDETCHKTAIEHGLTIRTDHVDSFIDYWKGVAGTKGVKQDWQATFRNQIRHLAKNNGKSHAANSKPTINDTFDAMFRRLDEAESRIDAQGGDSGKSYSIDVPRLRQSAA
jgi:hypothetical protein